MQWARRATLLLVVVTSALLAVSVHSKEVQYEGRGIGLSEDEKLSAAKELQDEEEKRFAESKASKEQKANKELEKMRLKEERRKQRAKEAAKAKAEGKVPPKPKPAAKKQAPPPKAAEEEDSAMLERVRGIGITDEEREAHAAELEREEASRMAIPEAEKRRKAQAELDKLNKKYGRMSSKDLKTKKKTHGSMGNSPSFFEFVAAQALEGVVQPALQHMTLNKEVAYAACKDASYEYAVGDT
eukprot:gene9149-18490_t